MKHFVPVLFSPIPGVIFVALLWAFLNATSRQNEVGLLERQPWPLSDIYACAAIGAVLTTIRGLVRWRHQATLRAELRALASMLGLAFEDRMSHDNVESYGLMLFDEWHRGANRLSGQLESMPIEMFDYTSVSRGTGRQRTTTYHTQTVAVLPASSVWRSFLMRPRNLATKVFEMLGLPQLRLRPANESALSANAKTTLSEFEEKYAVFVHPHDHDRPETSVDAESPDETPSKRVRTGGNKRKSPFTLPALQMFTRHAGWHVESSGEYVAFWRYGKVIPAKGRRRWLGEVLELYRALENDGQHKIAVVTPDTTKAWGRAVPAIWGYGAVGAFSGFFVSFLLFAPLAFFCLAVLDWGPWIVFLWPPFGLGFIAGGAWLGLRIAARRTESEKK